MSIILNPITVGTVGTVLNPVTVGDVNKVAVTVVNFNVTATSTIYTPASGKKIRIKAFLWSSSADIVTALYLGAGGTLLFPIQAKGVVAMNLIGCNVQGLADQALFAYLSGTGTMQGTVLLEEV